MNSLLKFATYALCLSFVFGMTSSMAQTENSVFTGKLKFDSQVKKKHATTTTDISHYGSFTEYFKSYKVFEIKSGEIHQKINKAIDENNEAIITLNLDNQYNWNLKLRKFDVLASNYVLSESINGNVISKKKITYLTYSGYVNGVKNNQTVLTIKEHFMNGYVLIDGIKYNIESSRHYDKNANPNEIIVYKSSDAVEPEGAECNNDDISIPFEKKIIKNSHKSKGEQQEAGVGTCIEMAVAIDADFNNKFADAEAEIIARVALLSDLYTNTFKLGIAYKLVELYIEKNQEISPIERNSVCQRGTTLGTDIQNWGNKVDGRTGFVNTFDIGSYWVTRDICGGGCGTVGCATISGVCKNSRYNVNEDFFSTTERNTIIWAHEIGHNLGAQHVGTNSENLMSTSLSGRLGDNFAIEQSTINSIINSRDNASCLTNTCDQPIANFTYDAGFCTSGRVNFTDNSTFTPTSWKWDFNNDGKIDATTRNPSYDFIANGKFPVKLTAGNDLGENSVSIDVDILLAPKAPVTNDVTRCDSGEVTLIATGSETLKWFDSPTKGQLLITGPTFTTALASSTDYYVENTSISLKSGGPKSPTTFSSGGIFDANDIRGLFFDAKGKTIIRSVLVEAEGSGNRTIELLDGENGEVLQSKVVNLTDGEQRITLDFDIEPGNGYFLKITGDLINLYRNNAGATFPIDIDGIITITGTNATGAGFYYYFYDWEIETQCASARTKATAIVDICNSTPKAKNNFLDLTIFPSPSTGLFTIETEYTRSETVNLEIRNTLGQLIQSEIYESNTRSQITIDLSNEPKGVYFVTSQIGENIITKKIVLE